VGDIVFQKNSPSFKTDADTDTESEGEPGGLRLETGQMLQAGNSVAQNQGNADLLQQAQSLMFACPRWFVAILKRDLCSRSGRGRAE